jgi:ATP-dependent DNA helicase DinG
MSQHHLVLPDAPALVAGPRGVLILEPDGSLETLSLREGAKRARERRPLVCHRTALQTRLGGGVFAAFDLLELFAFVRPASFCLPTPKGLAEALELPQPKSHEDEAALLPEAAFQLLDELARLPAKPAREAGAIALAMAQAGWCWGHSVLPALGLDAKETPHRARAAQGFRVWEKLPEWSDHAPEPPAGSLPVDPLAARRRLSELLGGQAEDRPQQGDYASAACEAFQPRNSPDGPRLVLAEAGTGTGKTLGYVAPASLWAETNKGAVWISTFTRNLQRQLDQELDRLHPDPDVKASKVVIRKGRENYLCLLNLEEAVAQMGGRPDDAIPLGLMARWTLASRDGDLVGGDFPGWLADLVGRARTLGLADRRGECIFSACQHYSRCFIERQVKRARRADIVVANHALVMVQAAMGGIDDDTVPGRLIFDEGHHLFDAADSAFAANLTGLETAELRRWLLGAEEGGRSRARGLKKRAEGLIETDEGAMADLDEALQLARHLPGHGWRERLAKEEPFGAAEKFLAHVRLQLLARAADTPYSLECETLPLLPGLAEAAAGLETACARMMKPLDSLMRRFKAKLADDAADLDTATRTRLEGLARSLERRALVPLAAWRGMLKELQGGADPRFIDWFSLEKSEGREVDVGHHRAWIDPTWPFAKAVLEPAQGALVTSATLRDGSGDVESDWMAAERRTGASHLLVPAMRAAMPSPYNYAGRTRVFVVTDVRKDDLDQVAAAYRELFLASGGGALGLFTAITRLREVHRRIAGPLDDAGLPLLAQHVDGLDNATLVDLFRADEESCLLGTDAMRDGVDVPGRSLRLLVFDRVPWPRPDIVHKARRQAFGAKAYDDMLTRLKLKQAFGRLIRKADDLGVFVLLDPMMPSRLAGAFPEGVTLERLGLAEAVARTRDFLVERI